MHVCSSLLKSVGVCSRETWYAEILKMSEIFIFLIPKHYWIIVNQRERHFSDKTSFILYFYEIVCHYAIFKIIYLCNLVTYSYSLRLDYCNAVLSDILSMQAWVPYSTSDTIYSLSMQICIKTLPTLHAYLFVQY